LSYRWQTKSSHLMSDSTARRNDDGGSDLF
jgi:hypothetical protein